MKFLVQKRRLTSRSTCELRVGLAVLHREAQQYAQDLAVDAAKRSISPILLNVFGPGPRM